ncbi:hypothetical protein HUT11_15205 [Streptomyces seoulensis]|nr:hypothetical protein HUT11_15205 [Streptomyces seoulensis]
MSWSPAIYKFVDGGDIPVPMDPATVRAVLEPYDIGDPQRTERPDGTMEFWVRAPAGGEAAMLVDEYGILVERPTVGGVFDIVAELLSRLGAVVLRPSDSVAVCRAEEHPHLPPAMREDALVIEMTGGALEYALTGPHPRRKEPSRPGKRGAA